MRRALLRTSRCSRLILSSYLPFALWPANKQTGHLHVQCFDNCWVIEEIWSSIPCPNSRRNEHCACTIYCVPHTFLVGSVTWSGLHTCCKKHVCIFEITYGSQYRYLAPILYLELAISIIVHVSFSSIDINLCSRQIKALQGCKILTTRSRHGSNSNVSFRKSRLFMDSVAHNSIGSQSLTD